MNIIVCIKQVPDTADIKWTKNNTLQREGMDSIINPFDEFALETALKIKDEKGAFIRVISMGPKQAEGSLKEGLALGCDEAAIICDRKFAAADTIATSTTIAAAIKNNFSDFDLIICGQFATDGDTAQTGPMLAEKLGLPQVTYVRKIIEILEDSIIVEKETDYGIDTLKVKLPALICVQKGDYELRQAKIGGYIFAQEKEIQNIGLENINIDENSVGLKGSPTYVSKAFRPLSEHNVEFINPERLAEIMKGEQ